MTVKTFCKICRVVKSHLVGDFCNSACPLLQELRGALESNRADKLAHRLAGQGTQLAVELPAAEA